MTKRLSVYYKKTKNPKFQIYYNLEFGIFKLEIYLDNYLINFLYFKRFGVKSPPKRFFLFSSYSEKPPSK
ncbi:hypothetical protein C8C83_4825 [Flavobacterium sp. 90]|nr:hypothetical protein C8C83_4825 [Flavobacterium sp. 90]